MITTYLCPPHSENTSNCLSPNKESVSLDSLNESSPPLVQPSGACDMGSLSNQTKKIRKKRCGYDKINDEKRIRLLEAVQNGESLKFAAQSLQINYSSAKSILHTFRKEGRILKKAQTEIVNRPSSMTNLASTLGNRACPGVARSEGGSPDGPNSPIRGLTSIFAGLMIDEEGDYQETGIMNILEQEVQRKEEENVEIPELQVPVFMSEFSVNFSFGLPSLETEAPKIPNFTEIANIGVPERQFLSCPSELLKRLDNFYMHYSNSPLSKGMVIDCSDSGSRRYCGEFESFSGRMKALQVQMTEQNQPLEFGIPSLYRFNSNISAQGNPQKRLMKQLSSDFSFMDRSEDFDSYMSGMDPQWLICDTPRKASLLTSLFHLQRSGSNVIAE